MSIGITPDYDRCRQVPLMLSPRDFVELTASSTPWARDMKDRWDADILRGRFKPRGGTGPLHGLNVDQGMLLAYWVRDHTALVQATSFLLHEEQEFQVLYDEDVLSSNGADDLAKLARKMHVAAEDSEEKDKRALYNAIAGIAAVVGGQSRNLWGERYVILTNYDPHGWHIQAV